MPTRPEGCIERKDVKVYLIVVGLCIRTGESNRVVASTHRMAWIWRVATKG